ncbi:YqzK family protein [Halalkalibacter okhensis]|uniref:Membrane protein n=1 Tax=Halalkalibacter okhensis TaxID=333138 RepID=A0A0B0IKB7_9BACI|nr:YqzK family protein [Halalkalibacter okhensis]KHF41745.1 membrane protein [Halalkalibacter okhensis]
MRSWFRLVIQTIKVFLLFMGCTLLFYYGILWVSQEYESYHRYDEPQGKAVKVFQMEQNGGNSVSWIDRLILFYREGE